jgi:hypothetical protein
VRVQPQKGCDENRVVPGWEVDLNFSLAALKRFY